MRVLVTGANGFVGRALVDHLSSKHSVVALLRDRTASVPNGVEARYVSGIDSTTDWDGLLGDIDTVVHLAARVHVMRETADDPMEAFREVNVRGTEKLAEACAVQGVRRVVFMSSIKVNGESTTGAPVDASTPTSPQEPYGLSKAEAECCLARISKAHGLEIVVLRPTVIFGPGVKGNIRRMIQLIRTRLPLPFGKVNNQRSMLSLQNLGAWVSRAVESPSVPKGPVLICDPYPISTRVLVRELSAAWGAGALQIPVPVGWLLAVARFLRAEPLVRRLVEDFAVTPTVEAFPGIEDVLVPTEVALRELGDGERTGRETSR